jgi:hypothetical protein
MHLFQNLTKEQLEPIEQENTLASKPDLGSLSSAVTQPEEGVGFGVNDAPGLDIPTLISEAQGKTEEPKNYTDLFGRETADKNLAAKQFTGLSAVSTGLKTVGALQQIRSQEALAMKGIKDQFNLSAREIELNSNLRRMAMDVQEVRDIVRQTNQINAQRVGGGRQRQQFIRNPRTGTLI